VKPLFEVNRGGFYVYISWTFDLLPPSFLLNKPNYFVNKLNYFVEKLQSHTIIVCLEPIDIDPL